MRAKDNPRILAFIPARGGSKRLPGKNLIDFAGKPLIGWTIAAAQQSSGVDKIVVSTDDQNVITYASEFPKIEVNQRRARLAEDNVPLIDVAIDYLSSLAVLPEYFLLLQPTSPLRTGKQIEEAIALIDHNDAVISVVKAQKPDEWSNSLPKNMSLENFVDEKVKNKQSQDFAQQFSLNGAIYLVKTNRLIEEHSFMLSSKIIAYEMTIETSVDIDTELDLFVATGFHLGLKTALKKLST